MCVRRRSRAWVTAGRVSGNLGPDRGKGVLPGKAFPSANRTGVYRTKALGTRKPLRYAPPKASRRRERRQA